MEVELEGELVSGVRVEPEWSWRVSVSEVGEGVSGVWGMSELEWS